MINWLQHVYSFFALVPFVAFLITWFIVYSITRNKRRSTHLSMDITTLFLIGSVAMMSSSVFGSRMLFWTILLLFLVAAGLLGNMQNRVKGRIDLVKIARTLSRLAFLVLSVCYAVLLVIGVGTYLLS
ncbi:DUF3397 domain-containing protein [Paenibacillus sp. YYML68]|uniref:DUF3397 domain-containing protein n=1 Tax=Paenibacillus sp. YYML68 TaxID=2909250 RepID=UPI0024904BBF|nr:DUF3397 domain-containing protein [Paenibacillus sp. YYML68]